MPTVSKKGNVSKKCDCKSQSTCAHPWYFHTGGRGTARKRGSLDKLLGKHAPDLTTAREWAKSAILAMKAKRDPTAEDNPTIETVLTDYIASRNKPWNDRWQVPCLCRVAPKGRGPVGSWRVDGLAFDALVSVLRLRPERRRDRDFALLSAAFNYAVRRGAMKSNPFFTGDECLWSKRPQDQRRRRLRPGEYEAILASAIDPDFADFFVGLIETGARSGELAQVQWSDISHDSIFLPAWKTKAKRDRSVPISAVLRGVLERRYFDPADKPHRPEAYVFGDAAGRFVAERKTAFLGAVLRAAGHQPHYVLTAKGGRTLAPDLRAAYRQIDLNIHDLRREACSRWVEAGIPLGIIMGWSGHSSLKQLSTYVAPAIGADAATMARYDALRAAVTPNDVMRGSIGGAFLVGDVQKRPFSSPIGQQNTPISA